MSFSEMLRKNLHLTDTICKYLMSKHAESQTVKLLGWVGKYIKETSLSIGRMLMHNFTVKTILPQNIKVISNIFSAISSR